MLREPPRTTQPDASNSFCKTPEHVSIHTPTKQTREHKHPNMQGCRYSQNLSENPSRSTNRDTCWGKPSRGEPVEPRSSDLWTQSSQRQEWQITPEVKINLKRGRRNSRAMDKQKVTEEKPQETEEETENASEVPLKSEWRIRARHATTQLHRTRHQRAFRFEATSLKHPENNDRTNNTYSRKLTEDTYMPNKPKERIAPVKIPYRHEIKIASINVSGMNESAQIEQIIQQMVRHSIGLHSGIKYSVLPHRSRSKHNFVFSSSARSNEDDWGIAFCYKRTFENYRTNYVQINSNVATMELSMNGNPLVIIDPYRPHDAALQQQQEQRQFKRTAAWEERQQISVTSLKPKTQWFVEASMQPYITEKKTTKHYRTICVWKRKTIPNY